MFNNKKIDLILAGLASKAPRNSWGSSVVLKAMAQALYPILEGMGAQIANKKPIRVLSIACGYPVELICLKALLPKDSFIFVGLDNDAEDIAKNQDFFKPLFPDVKFFCGDASKKQNIFKVLKDNAALPHQGFDLIFFRHPDFNSARKIIFTDMLQEAIPSVAAADAKVFISCYHQVECQRVESIARSLPAVFPLPQKTIFKENLQGVVIGNAAGQQVFADRFFALVECKGTAFKDLEQKNIQALLPAQSALTHRVSSISSSSQAQSTPLTQAQPPAPPQPAPPLPERPDKCCCGCCYRCLCGWR